MRFTLARIERIKVRTDIGTALDAMEIVVVDMHTLREMLADAYTSSHPETVIEKLRERAAEALTDETRRAVNGS